MHPNFRPHYDHIPEWEFYASAAESEYLQSTDEGLDIARYKELFDVVFRLPPSAIKQKLGDVLFDIVQEATPVDGYPYTEPSELDAIHALCKKHPFLGITPDRDTMRRKIEGAWTGRICGCMLGKSVEGIRTDELHPFLKDTGNYPMHRYIRHSDITDEHHRLFRFPFDERIYIDQVDSMPPDDDTNYTVMVQQLIDSCGRDFTPLDVLQAWPYAQRRTSFCTAERVAYCNYMKGLLPPDSATYKNPYREWIGAQIRADYYGYINPGDPQTAADMAFRDASVSHTKNGIYGAMFVAAMIAGAAVNDVTENIIRIGLSQIPTTSRLYERISKVLDDYQRGVEEQCWFSSMRERYNEIYGHDWAHTISNAEIVVACLLYGGGDYSRSICMAVENGFDTDCNAATVGSVIGMQHGIEGIDPIWSEPFHGILRTTLTNRSSIRIHELVDKTMEHLL